MGQKVNPIGIRLKIAKSWNSVWYADNRNYAKFLNQDLLIRDYIFSKLKNASVSNVYIERTAKNLQVIIATAKPGIVIGKKGEDIERLRLQIAKHSGVDIRTIKLNISEIRKPEIEASLVAQNIASQLERRIMFRRAMKRSVTNCMRLGAKGIKVSVGGRLNGAEIARTEWYLEGRVPLHTLRSDIDYGTASAATTYGIIGVKVWICKGEVFNLEEKTKSLKGLKGK
ncbi:MAG: 30S ribosomal protein S3 [Gammaproteobacteria bacterium]|nr:MAG: 30S ribosomal protein S3 [Gammaproteobacteria bacterium]